MKDSTRCNYKYDTVREISANAFTHLKNVITEEAEYAEKAKRQIPIKMSEIQNALEVVTRIFKECYFENEQHSPILASTCNKIVRGLLGAQDIINSVDVLASYAGRRTENK